MRHRVTLAQSPHCVRRVFTSLPVNVTISCCNSALHACYCNFPLNLFSPSINSFIPPCIDSTHLSADTPQIFNLFVCSIVSALITSMFSLSLSHSRFLQLHVTVSSCRLSLTLHRHQQDKHAHPCSAMRVISYRQPQGF